MTDDVPTWQLRPDAQQLADILRAAYTCPHAEVTHSDPHAAAGHFVGVARHRNTCGIHVPGKDCTICQGRVDE